MATLAPKQFAPPCPSSVPFEHPESFIEVSQNFKQVLKYISDLLCKEPAAFTCEDICNCPPCEAPPDETGIVPEIAIELSFVPFENVYADRHSWISQWGNGGQNGWYIFETTTGLLKGTVPGLNFHRGGAAPSPSRHEMWIPGRGSGGIASIHVYDTLTFESKASYTYPGFTGKNFPAAIARCPDDDMMYVAFGQGVAQIDPETGALVKSAGFGDVRYMAWHAGHHAMICGDTLDHIWSFKPGLTDLTGKSAAMGGLIDIGGESMVENTVDPRNGFSYLVPSRTAFLYRWAGREPTAAEGAHNTLSNAGFIVARKFMHCEYMKGVGVAVSRQLAVSETFPNAVYPGEVQVYDGTNLKLTFSTIFPTARNSYCENNHAVSVISDYWIGRVGGALEGRGFIQWFALGDRVEVPDEPTEPPIEPPDQPPIEDPPDEEPPEDPEDPPEEPEPPPDETDLPVVGAPPSLSLDSTPYECLYVTTSGNPFGGPWAGNVRVRARVKVEPASGELEGFMVELYAVPPGGHPNTDSRIAPIEEIVIAEDPSLPTRSTKALRFPGWSVVYEAQQSDLPECQAGPPAEPYDLFARHHRLIPEAVSPWSGALQLRPNLPEGEE